MSYCRWSSDDFGCDLYCYEDWDGVFVTHVAARRIVGEPPGVYWSLLVGCRTQEFMEQYRIQEDFLRRCSREPIGLPADGETFLDGTLEEFRERLIWLRGFGYRFSDMVLDVVNEEILGQACKNNEVTQ